MKPKDGEDGGRPLRGKALFLFDLDGVFYKGKESRVKLGGTEVVRELRSLRKKMFVLTNNSTDSVETIRSRLKDFDVQVREGEILTSGLLTADYLRRRHGRSTYFLVGERGLEAEMKKAGHSRVDEGADFVVVGLDRHLTYWELDKAAKLARSGARIVATHDSRLYMSDTGPAMATGPIVRALEFASGRKATVIGKPSPLMFKMALELARCDRRDAVMVGDQLDTDCLGAQRAGVDFVLVKTGVDQSAHGKRVVAVLDNVDALVDLL